MTGAPSVCVGDKVLYMPEAAHQHMGPGPWTALVTGTCDPNGAPLGSGVVWLTIFPPFALPANCNVPVPYDATGLPHTWTKR